MPLSSCGTYLGDKVEQEGQDLSNIYVSPRCKCKPAPENAKDGAKKRLQILHCRHRSKTSCKHLVLEHNVAARLRVHLESPQCQKVCHMVVQTHTALMRTCHTHQGREQKAYEGLHQKVRFEDLDTATYMGYRHLLLLPFVVGLCHGAAHRQRLEDPEEKIDEEHEGLSRCNSGTSHNKKRNGFQHAWKLSDSSAEASSEASEVSSSDMKEEIFCCNSYKNFFHSYMCP